MQHLLRDDELLENEPDTEALRHARDLFATNSQQAIVELKALADRGSALAMQSLAQIYKVGDKSDFKKCAYWYRRAYEEGSSNAAINLGLLYYRNSMYSEAEKVFSDGASKEDGPSMVWLAITYLRDQKSQEKKSLAMALLEKASAAGQIRAKSYLGLMLLKGQNGVTNIPRGILVWLDFLVSGLKVAYRDPKSRQLW